MMAGALCAYAYTQFIIQYITYLEFVELTPPGFDNMFFGLFGLSNRASSMIGPNVIQAIIDNTRQFTDPRLFLFFCYLLIKTNLCVLLFIENNWQGFPFLFALCAAASLVIWFGVDIQKGRRDAVRFGDEKRKGKGKGSQERDCGDEGEEGDGENRLVKG